MHRSLRILGHLSPATPKPSSTPVPCAGKVFDDPSEALDLNTQVLFGVQGKIALVTGGSKGIGLMIAKGLVQNGAKVYVCSRKKNLCEKAAALLNQGFASGAVGGGSAVSLPGDLSTEAGCVAVAAALSQLESHLDILVNNAGATWGAPLEGYPDRAWEKVFDLNVRGVFNLTQKLLPLLANGGQRVGGEVGRPSNSPSRIINISSVDGVRPTQTYGPAAAFAYTASKGAVNTLTVSLCRAVSEMNITCNAIAPGLFPSNMTKFMFQNDGAKEMANNMNPLKRFGRTADMAGTVLFLCSTAGSWVNGTVIPVDGGQIVH